MKIRNSFVLLSAALLAGCATTGQEVAAGYTQALEIERGCMQASKFNETPLCYKQQSELIGQLPPHKNQFAFIGHLERMYRIQMSVVKGRMNPKEADAAKSSSLSELRADMSMQERADQQQRANVSRALSDFSRATAPQPVIRCRSNPNIFGGFDSTCQ